MKGKFILFISMFLCISSISYAQEGAEIIVEDIQICTSVEDRVPVGVDTMFSSDIEKLYCFTRLKCGQDVNTVAHVWTYNDKEMARVELTTRAKTWRTWSSKRILPAWKGKWRVDVVSPDGDVLASKDFEIK
jgi:hypothetical protein